MASGPRACCAADADDDDDCSSCCPKRHRCRRPLPQPVMYLRTLACVYV